MCCQQMIGLVGGCPCGEWERCVSENFHHLFGHDLQSPVSWMCCQQMIYSKTPGVEAHNSFPSMYFHSHPHLMSFLKNHAAYCQIAELEEV
mmetsp:Transcript_11325/g.17884  ORF Transcript_11325/g.17884 Transcript_11325/m.17884 type:complete len:91 (-) Transcript_11325:200-472(-)